MAGLAAALTAALTATTALVPVPALAQSLDYTTFGYPGSSVTTVTGIRGDNMTGNYSIANSGGDTGGLLYTLPSLVPAPFPSANSPPVNFPGATSATPYGPSFGSTDGILRVVGSYKTTTSGAYNLGYLYDGAAAPGQQITTLIAPAGGSTTLNTIAHSTFGNQVVGNFDTMLATGNAFLYDIPSGTFTTINRPGAVSTTAYGVYGNRIAGGSTDGLGLSRAYILNQDTGVYTTYNAPGIGNVVTHFEGITSGGRANTFNLVADSVDDTGAHAWVVHVDASGTATWTELTAPVPGATTVSANSIYGDTAIGVYVLNGVTYSFTVAVPGIYNPITNSGVLTAGTAGAAAISANGDDIANSGTITASGAGSMGISSTYGVVTNSGSVTATGAGSTAVLMTGQFGTLLNSGTISAAPGAFALQTASTASGTWVVNTGIIDGAVAIAAGPNARFENSGWMGIGAPGAGVTHQVSGTFAQTSSGTLSLRVAPNGVSDQLLVDGVARLAGTAQAVFQPGNSFSRSYTLVTATGGLTGTFGTLSTQNMPAFLSASLGYGGNTVTLSLRSAMASLPGVSGNNAAVAQALDGAFNSGPGLNAVPGLYGLSQAEIVQALTVLSGSNASVGQSASLAAGGTFTAMIAGRGVGQRDGRPVAQNQGAQNQGAQNQGAQAATCGDVAEACDATAGWSFWANGFGGAQWLNADGGTAAPAANQSLWGGAIGADYRVGAQTLVGAAVGLSDNSYWVGATGANGRATGFHAGLYGLQEWGASYLAGALSYSRFDGNATRPIAGIGTTETAKSSAIANQFAGRIEVGHSFELAPPEGGRLAATPFVAFQPSWLWTPAYGESSVTATGAPGVFALNYQAQATTSLPLSLGVQFDTTTEVGARPLSAWVRTAWVHEFSPDRSVTAGFTVLPGTSFMVDGARAAYNAARVDLGVRYDIAPQTALYANGGAELSYRGQSIAGTVGLRFFW